MVVARVHAGGTDRCGFLVGEVGNGEAAAAGDGYRLPLCHHAVMAKISGEFGCGDRGCRGLGLSMFA